MDNALELSVLFDYYGSLLTQTQQTVCMLYFNQNLSLNEIAENLGITRQGVRDALKKSEKLLLHYEANLKVKEKNDTLEGLLQAVTAVVDQSKLSEKEKNTIKQFTIQIGELI